MVERARWEVWVHGVIDPSLAVTTEDFGGAVAALTDRSQEADELLAALHISMTAPAGLISVTAPTGYRWPMVELALENAGWMSVPDVDGVGSRNVVAFYGGTEEVLREKVRRVLAWEHRRRTTVAVPIVETLGELDTVGSVVGSEVAVARALSIQRPAARFLGAALDGVADA